MASLSTSSSPPSPTQQSEASDGSSERRLREAEDRLREAIEELQRRQRSARRIHLPCDHADESCVANAIGNLCQTFLLSYGVRAGIGILLRAFKLARGQSYSSLLDLKQLVSEKNLIMFVEKVEKERDTIQCHWMIQIGGVPLLCIFWLGSPSVLITLQSPRTSFTCGEAIGEHGDALLFALACAQVMYAFVMRPESLPKSYQDFIQKTGPVARPVYKAVRDCCRDSPVDVSSLSAYLSNKRASNFVKLEEFPLIIPCSIIHPDTNSCLAHNTNAASATFRKTFPLYFSLTFVPFVVLHLQKFTDAPVRTCWLAVKGAVRSTSFLSAFVGIFQGVICLHRKVASKDHKLVYWVAGGISALSVLLEKKARRGELALYVLPRAGDSLWYILVNRHLLPDIKNAEVALFCLCMGGIMYYLEHEPDTMAPFLRGLIRRFLASRISNPAPPSNRSTSYTYLQALDAMKKPKLQDNRRS
ncbi:mitochondrial import inner membrane translocase subunit Tim17/Tim22/Tim23 family protein [Actinidia rufa]|uniref:Mitochondrial import inner membrane translocase subunit Tim17/Tim22/Tim23 family protein n=1 Tax=Actinidia rufa TaxID=165716 RepID=A0A7J0E684_9ERIC|nr:mitochondrial import inner membrane translocase subunit Tim17/Tim22/Tim23 family protein [Actinidia rufa]